MKVVVLISCMNEKDYTIIERTNLRTDAVIINQTDSDSIQNIRFISSDGVEHTALFVNSSERGLSRSRNMAIEYAEDAEICLICDDDERLEDDYETKIVNAYSNAPLNTVLIAFAFRMDAHSCPMNYHRFSFKDIMRTSSVQITFRRDFIIKHHISFDVLMGSGSGNGGGEENKFMLDVWKNGAGMLYVPDVITFVNKGNSKWNSTVSSKYFKNLGWSSRRLLGFFPAGVYILFHSITHYRSYSEKYGFFTVLKYMFSGFFDKR